MTSARIAFRGPTIPSVRQGLDAVWGHRRTLFLLSILWGYV
jgi:hypothetical protein